MNVNSSIIFATFALVFHIWWVAAMGEPADEIAGTVGLMMVTALLILVSDELQNVVNWVVQQFADRYRDGDADA